MSRVYLDHNATTPVRPEVIEAMLPYLQTRFGNPSSVHRAGQEARAAVEAARSQVARLLNADAPEIVFTSGGSESDVLAISGAAQQGLEASAGARRHIVTTAVEHEAVRELMARLRRRGFDVTAAPVDGWGRVDCSEVRRSLRDSTVLVTVMLANNEVGTLQPVREIASLCRERGIACHTDAVQAVGKIPVDVERLGVDLLSLSGHKINAPKGVGALYVRKGVRLSPLITGRQERNRRGGTENVAGIVALGRACELIGAELPEHSRRLSELRRRLEAGCLGIPGSRLNGHPEERLPGTSHFSFEGVEGHPLVVALDIEGVCASSGSACASGATEPSQVLMAMGVEPALAAGSLRLSMGWGSGDADVDRVLDVLPRAVGRLRGAVSKA